jgi:hypothetical protein
MPEETANIVGFRERAFERLEPCDGKLSCTVPRGARGLVTVLWAGNGPRLPNRMSGKLDTSSISRRG